MDSNNLKNKNTEIIAVCGKGGVGKTSISALIVKILAENKDKKILAIDADPAIGLASAIGFSVRKTVDDIRNELIHRVESGTGGNKKEILSLMDYEIFDALGEQENMAFLAIGRPEKAGCYCKVNVILKDIIEAIAGNFDYVVIDGEAGIEQVNRRVMETVSILLTVSDASAKGLNVVQTIKKVAREAVDYKKFGLILNRIRNSKEKERLNISDDLNLLGWIPEDDMIRNFDIDGKSLINLPPCPALDSIRHCVMTLIQSR